MRKSRLDLLTCLLRLKAGLFAFIALLASLHFVNSFTDIDDCVNHTCNNGGSCEDGVNSYSCNCPGGYTGYYCETGKLM